MIMIIIIIIRFGNGQGAEYAESYLLEYWRPRLGRWVRYRNIHNSEVIKIIMIMMMMMMVMIMMMTTMMMILQVMEGNSNTYLAAKQELTPVIIASKVEIIRIISFIRNLKNLDKRGQMIEMEVLERRKLVGQVVEIGEGQLSRFRSFPNLKKTNIFFGNLLKPYLLVLQCLFLNSPMPLPFKFGFTVAFSKWHASALHIFPLLLFQFHPTLLLVLSGIFIKYNGFYTFSSFTQSNFFQSPPILLLSDPVPPLLCSPKNNLHEGGGVWLSL